MERCCRTVLLDSIQGTYDQCGRPVKYEVSYIGVTGKIKTERLCGVHMNAVRKNSERVNKLMKEDYTKFKSIVL